jgi:uncharacterized membrane protein YtjA (UPF0391 family)
MNLGNLLYWAVVFLVIAVVAALFGFGGIAGTAMEGAKIIFWIAVVLFVISLVFGFMRRGPEYAAQWGRPLGTAAFPSYSAETE